MTAGKWFRDYFLYGLNIRSELPLPASLSSDGGPQEAQVTISVARTPNNLGTPLPPGSWHQVRGPAFLFAVPGIARYLILAGSRIIVQPHPAAGEHAILGFLLGTACGVMLHQRGYLVLHASAIATEQGAVLFAGPSGSGKSTLVAALQRRGYRLLTDDVCAISFDSGSPPVVYAGPPHIKLWRDTATALGYDVTSLRLTDLLRHKYLLPADYSHAEGPLPLHIVYAPRFTRGSDLQIQPLPYWQRVEAVLQNTYRGHYLKEMGLAGDRFKRMATLVAQIPVKRVARPRDLGQLEQVVQLIEADLARAEEPSALED